VSFTTERQNEKQAYKTYSITTMTFYMGEINPQGRALELTAIRGKKSVHQRTRGKTRKVEGLSKRQQKDRGREKQ